MFLYHSHLFFSSLLSDFLTNLKEQVTKKNPFQPIYIVVENHYIKKYLQLEIAKKIGISANIFFFYINDFVDFFYYKATNQQENNFLNREYLKAIIQKSIKENINKPLYKNVKEYLKENSPSKFYDLTNVITELFDKYIYFCEKELHEWNFKKKVKNWQIDLWQQITSSYSVKLPKEKLSLIENFIQQNDDFLENIFFFNYKEIPDFLIDFFQNIKKEKRITIDFYSLSIFHNYANKYIKKINNDKQIYQQISKKKIINDKEAIKQKNTFLEVLQQKMFFSKEIIFKKKFKEKDDSIQIASFLNKKREVEILKEKILFFFENNIQYENILVICPSVEDYQSLIEVVFDRDIIIPYNIEIQKDNQIWQRFLSLLTLLEGTIFFKDILFFLQDINEDDSDYFLTLEEATALKSWLRKNKIFHDDKKDIFDNKWQKTINRFFENYLIYEEEYISLKIETFEKFLKSYHEINSYQKQITKPKKIANWIVFFKFIFKQFFNKNFQNENDYLQCLLILDEEKKIANEIKNEQLFSFQEIIYSLRQKKKLNTNKENFLKKGVNFINTFNFNLFDFEAIGIIGINQKFLTKEKKNTFDILNFSNHRGYPLKDRDYHFFLMTIFYARKFFYLSFVNENKEKIIPFIIKDLLLKLKDFFPEVEEKQWLKNYFTSGYDENYFQEEKEYYPTWNTQISQKIITLKNTEKKIKKNKSEEIFKKEITKKKIALEEMIQFFQNPIQFFQKNQLHLKFDYEEEDLDFYSLPEEKLNFHFFKNYSDLEKTSKWDKKNLIEKSLSPDKIDSHLFLEKYDDIFNFFQKEQKKELNEFHLHEKKALLQINDYEILGKINYYSNEKGEAKLFYYSTERNSYRQFISFLFEVFFFYYQKKKINKQFKKSIFLDIINKRKFTIHAEIPDIKKEFTALIKKWHDFFYSNETLFLPPKSTYAFFIGYINKTKKKEKIEEGMKNFFYTWNGDDFRMGEKNYSTMKYFFENNTENFSQNQLEEKVKQNISLFLPLLECISLEKVDY